LPDSSALGKLRLVTRPSGVAALLIGIVFKWKRGKREGAGPFISFIGYRKLESLSRVIIARSVHGLSHLLMAPGGSRRQRLAGAGLALPL